MPVGYGKEKEFGRTPTIYKTVLKCWIEKESERDKEKEQGER